MTSTAGVNETETMYIDDPTYILAKSGPISITATGGGSSAAFKIASGSKLVLGSTLASNTTYDVTSSTSNVTFDVGNKGMVWTAQAYPTIDPFEVNTTGTASFLMAAYNFNTDWITFGNTLSGLTIGKSSGNTGNVVMEMAVSVGGPIEINATDISIGSALTATNSNISLYATGAVTQTAAITASGLVLRGAASFTLANASNAVSTLTSGSSIGALSFVNSTNLTIGSVDFGGVTYSGLNSTGTISVKTTRDLTISQNVATTSTSHTASAPALLLAAGSSGNSGDVTYNIILSGSPAFSMGPGGIADFYSGGDSESTGLNAYIGGKSSKTFTYNATMASQPTAAGYNVIYRGNPPVVYLTIVDNQSTTYVTASALSYW